MLHAEGSDDWTLQIKYVQKRDNGTYECQVSEKILVYWSSSCYCVHGGCTCTVIPVRRRNGRLTRVYELFGVYLFYFVCIQTNLNKRVVFIKCTHDSVSHCVRTYYIILYSQSNLMSLKIHLLFVFFNIFFT